MGQITIFKMEAYVNLVDLPVKTLVRHIIYLIWFDLNVDLTNAGYYNLKKVKPYYK